MKIYNLVEYREYYSKALGSLWQYYTDEPVLTYSGTISSFHTANNSIPFKSKQKITGK